MLFFLSWEPWDSGLAAVPLRRASRRGSVHASLLAHVPDRTPDGLADQLCRIWVDLEGPTELPGGVGLPGDDARMIVAGIVTYGALSRRLAFALIE